MGQREVEPFVFLSLYVEIYTDKVEINKHPLTNSQKAVIVNLNLFGGFLPP